MYIKKTCVVPILREPAMRIGRVRDRTSRARRFMGSRNPHACRGCSKTSTQNGHLRKRVSEQGRVGRTFFMCDSCNSDVLREVQAATSPSRVHKKRRNCAPKFFPWAFKEKSSLKQQILQLHGEKAT
uniref:Uncharacterized protein n=1 Tax=Rhodosorus marinus TaxID=101924 RepID=A0A7S3EFH0_9RHOD